MAVNLRGQLQRIPHASVFGLKLREDRRALGNRSPAPLLDGICKQANIAQNLILRSFPA